MCSFADRSAILRLLVTSLRGSIADKIYAILRQLFLFEIPLLTDLLPF